MMDASQHAVELAVLGFTLVAGVAHKLNVIFKAKKAYDGIFGSSKKKSVVVEKSRDAKEQSDAEKRLISIYEIDERIQTEIEMITTTMRAARVSILELHNGNKNLNELPMEYVSVRYESYAPRSRSRFEQRQNMRGSRYHQTILKILQHNRVFIHDVDYAEEHKEIAELIRSEKCFSVYLFPILGSGLSVPYIGMVEFQKPDGLAIEDIDFVCGKFGTIGGIKSLGGIDG